MDKNNSYNNLIQVLNVLSASFKDQIKVFPDFVVIPDEIALLFYDIYLSIDSLKKDRFVSPELALILEKIDCRLDSMSSDKSKWDLQSLKNDSEWEEIRNLAKSSLRILNIHPDKPVIDFVKWIK